MKLRSQLLALASVFFAGAAVLPGRAQAAMLFTLAQVGNDVVVTESGTLDLTALSGPFVSMSAGSGLIRPSNASVLVGSNVSFYQGMTGPATFGPGSTLITAASMTGSAAGIQGNVSTVYVPVGYVSGTMLSGTATFTNQTLATLGFTPNTYVYTWGTGTHADSLTITSAVPEPSTWALLGVGAVGAGLILRRRRLTRA